jgi:tRNA(Ile)-lysidine synthase
MKFSPETLWAHLQPHLPSQAEAQLCVAFSGGLDSTVLLVALSHQLRSRRDFRLRAVHIDHRLQSASAQWTQHCFDLARTLDIDCVARQVSIDTEAEEGIEAAARTARYRALSEMLNPGEILLTAHHADDQLETVLLALARGAGLAGLAAMSPCQSFAHGTHVRPMLPFTRDEIEHWARSHSLAWISDPSNMNAQFSRNLLRSEVTPSLKRRWPSIARTASRSASHLADAESLLDELAMVDQREAQAGSCLRIASLASMSSARRRNLLRYWLRERGARAPSTRKLFALEQDMLNAADDRNPRVTWDGFEVRRYRGLLYAGPSSPRPAVLHHFEWKWRDPLELGNGLGRLRVAPSSTRGLDEARLPAKLRVEFRQGGERLQPSGRAHHHELKKLLQEASVLPWWRKYVPLIWSGDALVAVGDLWIAEEFTTQTPTRAVEIVWERRPSIFSADDSSAELVPHKKHQ